MKESSYLCLKNHAIGVTPGSFHSKEIFDRFERGATPPASFWTHPSHSPSFNRPTLTLFVRRRSFRRDDTSLSRVKAAIARIIVATHPTYLDPLSVATYPYRCLVGCRHGDWGSDKLTSVGAGGPASSPPPPP